MAELIQNLSDLFKARGFPYDMGPRLEKYVGDAEWVWRFSSASVVFDEQCRILVQAINESSTPVAGVRIRQETVAADVWIHSTGAGGIKELPMEGDGSGYWPPNQGPQRISIEGAPSDRVIGIGLPFRHHADFSLIFQLQRNQDDDDDNGQTEEPPGCLLAILQIVKRTLIGGGK